MSVVICTHEGADRLPTTLRHLAEQHIDPAIAWEIIVVDNASTQPIEEVVSGSWADIGREVVPKVVREPRLGLSNARHRGLLESKYEIVALIDDDNWVRRDWVMRVFRTLASHPDVGACGGRCEPVFEVPPPPWFEEFAGSFAVGRQLPRTGYVPLERGYLWGAGLAIRREAWLRLIESGFQLLTADRRGRELTSGGDSELCYGLLLSGWKLWYDNELILGHQMPRGRMDWTYLRRLHRGFGASWILHTPYLVAMEKRLGGPEFTGRATWAKQMALSAKRVLKIVVRQVMSGRWLAEGRPEVLSIERLFGQMQALGRLRSVYDQRLTSMVGARWISTDQPTSGGGP